MARKRLTAVAVRNLRPGKDRREIPDAHGLHLIIQPTGKKSWALRTRRPDGRSCKITLGPVSDLSGEELKDVEPVIGAPLTLPAARKLAAHILHNRARGADVAADAVAAKRRRKHLDTDTDTTDNPPFAKAAADYITHARAKQRRWREAARFLGIDFTTLKPVPRGLAERWGREAGQIDRRQRGFPPH
jgi:Arm DNA-binding domain